MELVPDQHIKAQHKMQGMAKVPHASWIMQCWQIKSVVGMLGCPAFKIYLESCYRATFASLMQMLLTRYSVMLCAMYASLAFHSLMQTVHTAECVCASVYGCCQTVMLLSSHCAVDKLYTSCNTCTQTSISSFSPALQQCQSHVGP